MTQDSHLSMDDLRLSELVDGELDCDEANALLLDVLDDAASRDHLRRLLELRHALAAWRCQRPALRQMVTDTHLDRHGRHVSWRQTLGLATAAVIGGLLVMGGFMMARHKGNGVTDSAAQLQWARMEISAEAVHEAASVFSLHESVGGPLKWYAADDQNIQIASIEGASPQGRPVVIFLHVAGTAGPTAADKNYVIVCREDERATIRFPSEGHHEPGVRIALMPHVRGGGIEIRYAISLGDMESAREQWASLAGQRDVGMGRTQLGLMTLGSRQFNVGASARLLADEANWETQCERGSL